MKKALKITIITLSSILIFLLILNILVSPIATSYINKNGKQLLGRKVQVEKIKVNILAGSLKIRDFYLYEEDENKEWISLDTLDVNTKLFRLLTHQLYIQHINVAGLDVNITQNDTIFNFTSFLNHFSSSDETESSPKKKWDLAFYDIRLSHGAIYYTDLMRNCEWNLDDINFETPGFSISERASTNAGINIKLADGGNLHTTAQYDVNSNNFTINLDLKEMPITNLKAYLKDVMKIGKSKGTLDANLVANGNLGSFPNVDIVGDMKLNNLNIKSEDKKPLLAINQIHIDINTINCHQNKYYLNNLTIDQLESQFKLYPDGNTFSKLFIQDSATADSTKNESQTPQLKLRINHFNLTNSKVLYADYTLPEKFEYQLSNINIESNSITLHGTNTAHITMELPHKGAADIQWSGTIDDWKSHQNLNLIIEGLRLKDLSPYSIAYLRYPFTNGILSFKSENNIQNSNVNATHHLNISKAEVGKKHTEVDAPFKIPLKTVLYVLSDKDEQININLPVTGDLNNPEFKYSKAIWHAIGTLLTKVATEPFRMVNDAFGISNQDRYIAINPTDSVFTKSQYKLLEKYAKTLEKEPTLKINFEQHVDPNAEDFIFEIADQRNQHLREHLTNNLHIDTSRFAITTVDSEDLKKPGYHISGQLIDSLMTD